MGLCRYHMRNGYNFDIQLIEDRGVFPNNRYMDNLFLNRMITPEANKTRGKRS